MKIYRLFHFLSLDIVLGALAVSCLASRLFHSFPGWAWWAALALSVWLLYMGDHVLDAWKHRKQGQRDLHIFIFSNRRIILWTMGVAAILDMLIIFNFLEVAMLKVALVLGGLVLLFYAMRHLFRRNRFLFVPGEIFVLLLYLAGTWMGPFMARTVELQQVHGMVMIMMAGVLLMNLGIISLYDAKLDSRLGIPTLARALGQRLTRNMMVATAAAILLLSLMQLMVFGTDTSSQFVLILSGMAVLLLIVLLFPTIFRKSDAYRLTADAVLYMGFLSLLVP